LDAKTPLRGSILQANLHAIRLTFAFLLFSEFIYVFMANDAVENSHRIFSFYYFLFSSLYLTSFAVIGCAIVVELERTARHAYARERQLAVSNQSIKKRTRSWNS
jgi:hypothetical protein